MAENISVTNPTEKGFYVRPAVVGKDEQEIVSTTNRGTLRLVIPKELPEDGSFVRASSGWRDDSGKFEIKYVK